MMVPRVLLLLAALCMNPLAAEFTASNMASSMIAIARYATGGAAAWPVVARAQRPAMPVVGFLGTTRRDDFADRAAAFREGLKKAGYVEGQNVVIRSTEGQYDQLPALVADLVRQHVALIVGNTPSALSTKAATTTVPIIFVTGGDPRSGTASSPALTAPAATSPASAS